MIRIRHHHVAAFFLVVGFVVAASFSFSQKVSATTCGTGSNVAFTDIGGGQCRAFLTSGASWTVPNDWNNSNNTIEVIGGGGGGFTGGFSVGTSGGGGGAYSKITNLALVGGNPVTYQVGSGGGIGTNGGDTYFNGTGATCSAQSVCAKGGNTGANAGVGGIGGSSASGIGTGNSGGNGASAAGGAGGGGGGAGGPNGVGNNGVQSVSAAVGGSGDAGFGGSGGTFGAPGGPGGNGTEFDTSHGSGGGGGAGSNSGQAGGTGGNYGGGGGGGGRLANVSGSGAQGIIVITYTPIVILAPTCTLTPSSQTITNGNPATLNYAIGGSATTATINGVSVATSASGSYSPSPSSSTSYTMTVSNSGGSSTCGPAAVTVNPTGTAITGWAWSDTVGWISLSGTGYGLSIASNGTVSGYAWSDNIGWISANSSDVAGCPSGTCTPKISAGALTGWLKALSADGNGWDGWISLSGSGYGPTLANGAFTGYSWGSDVVGWVDWSLARSTYAQCTPSTVYTCSPVSGYDTNGNSTVVKTVTDSSCAVTLTNAPVCHTPYFCSAGSATCLSAPPSFNQNAGHTGHLQAIPSLVPQGLPTTLFWNVSSVTGCSVAGSNNDHWTGASSPVNGQASSALEQQTTFTLACTGADGTPVNEVQVVNILPIFQER